MQITTNATTATMIAPLCPRCGGVHVFQQCPQVRAIEYYPDGSIKRVEFLAPGDYLPPSRPDWPRPYDVTMTAAPPPPALVKLFYHCQ